MRPKNGLSLFLLMFVLGAALICSPAGDPEQARHHVEYLQGAAGHADHLDACEDDQPVLTAALQGAELLGRSGAVSSSFQEAHQTQGIGGGRFGMAADLPAFLTGSPPQGKAPTKLYKLYLSFLI